MGRCPRKQLLYAVALVFFMIGTIEESVGASYFVSPRGSDTNAGAQLAPFKTIQKAATIMVAGDTCYIRAGTYRETVVPANSGNANAPITFQAYQKEKVVVSGADLISSPWKRYKGNIYTATMPWILGPGRTWCSLMASLSFRRDTRTTTPVIQDASCRPLGCPRWMTFGNFNVHPNSPNITNPTDLDQNQENYCKKPGSEHNTC